MGVPYIFECKLHSDHKKVPRLAPPGPERARSWPSTAPGEAGRGQSHKGAKHYNILHVHKHVYIYIHIHIYIYYGDDCSRKETQLEHSSCRGPKPEFPKRSTQHTQHTHHEVFSAVTRGRLSFGLALLDLLLPRACGTGELNPSPMLTHCVRSSTSAKDAPDRPGANRNRV